MTSDVEPEIVSLGKGTRVRIGDRDYIVVAEDGVSVTLDEHVEPRYLYQPVESRTGAFVTIMVLLLAVLGGVLWALAKTLGVL